MSDVGLTCTFHSNREGSFEEFSDQECGCCEDAVGQVGCADSLWNSIPIVSNLGVGWRSKADTNGCDIGIAECGGTVFQTGV